MDAAAPAVHTPLKVRRWLPYWAVLQTDLRQTLHSWVYLLWVTVSVLAAVGYLLYRFGVHREAGIIQAASVHTSDVLRGIVLGSMALIVVLTVSAIAAERNTLADAVLSRGISRHQYFLAKWHSRTFVVLVTFLMIASVVLLGSHFLLSEDLTLSGSLTAIATVSVVLAVIVACGVAIGALANSTIIGITLLWILLYGSGFLMTLLPNAYPSPDRILRRLPHMLQGNYDIAGLGDLALFCLVATLIAAGAGMIGFSRKDV